MPPIHSEPSKSVQPSEMAQHSESVQHFESVQHSESVQPPVSPSSDAATDEPLQPDVITTVDSVAEFPLAQMAVPEAPDVAIGDDQMASVQVIDTPLTRTAEPGVQPPLADREIVFELLKLLLIPTLILGAFAGGIVMLGLAQRYAWIDSVSEQAAPNLSSVVAEQAGGSWICPMMCVPPTNQAGRCPVCAMELVPASNQSSAPSSSIEIDPRSRRIAGIKTSVAQLQELSREISSVGEIQYDETRQKTLSAYIDGRIEALQADFTGVEVKQGQSLGRLYSPDLYSAQVEYLGALAFSQKSSQTSERLKQSNSRLLKSSRQRLLELGMTETQITTLETERVANRVLELYSPISGTVIEKLATTGQYIKAGTPIYRLADLSRVWLVLELFPEDARAVQIGQSVTATAESLGSESFVGTVEFIEPTVDPVKRTVGVRVAINNEQGLLKPREFVRASLIIPLSGSPEIKETVVISRDSLLSIGNTALAYVETKPGVFQLRKIKTGPSVKGMVAVLSGIEAGELVVSRSTFLLDAQMQLQGNPSLIDPDKAVVDTDGGKTLTDAEKVQIEEALAQLSIEDRELAEAQVICPVGGRLGSMGVPIKIEVEGRQVFICCEGCRQPWLENPAKYFKILENFLKIEVDSKSEEKGSEEKGSEEEGSEEEDLKDSG